MSDRPDPPSPRSPPLAERLAPLLAAIDEALAQGEPPPGLAALAARAGCSPFHLQRVFRAQTGLSPSAYARARRAQRLADTLPCEATVTAALHAAGYGSAGRFYAEAPARLGMAPRRWRAGGAGETIRFALGPCSLGHVLVAATARGLCLIELDDDPAVLLTRLQDRFPRAELRGAEPDFEEHVAAVIGLVEAPAQGLGLPLDLRGTLFQQRVWAALQAIPPGQTISYTALAQVLGLPRAARAVAAACAANPLAVAIPCHRVVRQDGDLAGYRWGLARKRQLLAREAAARPALPAADPGPPPSPPSPP
ncbi:methylated-DNA--[protein]-cysteine S-methyltransferase [Aquariibacter albus]|uniref:methylated-DNA--[protein]-cysteine S-methyltransferase n=1 Tax=Aquariibacter albus TaxID=2759899 RepID=A0A839HKY6_9BURK|nr:methylated-DNA--[protein]-cysteine S-methyltransferase [Aquariibacter albus]MBB1162813.1 methylated-DNA--[protein]-cysteine S-methyltransferase [Aquariibacter albus]